MKVLYICGTYCPSHGGAEISMHTLLKQLQRNFKVEVLVLTDFRYTQNKEVGNYDSVKLRGVSHENRERKIFEIIEEFKPDLILTQLMWSDVALKISKLKNIPGVLRVCKIPFNLDISKNSEYSPTGIIAVSKAVKKYVDDNWNRKCKIIFSTIEFDRILIQKENKNKKEYIMMFNPLIRKGGEIFRELTKRFPEKKFAVVYGWSCLKKTVEDKEFSDELIKRICESLGVEFTGKKPKYVDLSDCDNITVLEPTEDVWKIYAKSKILLIPSQWEEAFPRVAIEGMINGIPVVASSVGGSRDAVGKGGVLIKDYKNVDAWSRELIKFDDITYYEKVSEMGKKWVKNNYSLKQIIEEAFNFFNNVINSFYTAQQQSQPDALE